jgi:hypothetical protein
MFYFYALFQEVKKKQATYMEMIAVCLSVRPSVLDVVLATEEFVTVL